ncbi:MAG: flagellar basal-body rod protein FlgF [Gammaproteobacteria bacterium]|nr:flagellar basal-body rod protein FlgF [Gammaproteobacteria bacterium]
MDRLLYLAMNGARESMYSQSKVANNLANANTTGFRADKAEFRALPVFGDGHPSRVFTMGERPGYDFAQGGVMTTGRDLDVVVKGQGWLVVQGRDGSEGLTRAGDLRVNAEGVLETGSGLPVLGDGGPITLPPFETIEIGGDGTISIRPQGAPPTALVPVERLRLVNPDPKQLDKGADGLFRLRDGSVAVADASIKLASGALEGSNVNPVQELTELIELSRKFELQIKMMRTAQDNDAALDQLLQS